jgi:hypothetical protein
MCRVFVSSENQHAESAPGDITPYPRRCLFASHNARFDRLLSLNEVSADYCTALPQGKDPQVGLFGAHDCGQVAERIQLLGWGLPFGDSDRPPM